MDNKGKTEKSRKYSLFYQHVKKRNADAAKECLQRLNDAAEDGNCQVCMWILERRFPEDFGRRMYRKTNVSSANRNETIEIIVNEADGIRAKILEKFALGRENQESSTI